MSEAVVNWRQLRDVARATAVETDPRQLRVAVQTIQVRYQCTACGTGTMTYYGGPAAFPTHYVHTCSTCPAVESLDTKYPYIEYLDS